jgi:uncharacterized membrane protein YccF (DUF307 family)
MKTLGNIIWFLFGGFFIAVEYFLVSLLLMITIVGIPFGIQTMKLAGLALWPFGKEVVTKENAKTNGCLYTIMTIVWLIIGGLGLCLQHLLIGIFFFITIVGIPFGKQHMKLAGLALMPFGKEFRDKPKK